MFSITDVKYNSTNNESNENNYSPREAGIIEKLLPSYGFIQCCERQARLFFHYSQFTGNIDHLKVGDPVEFEMTYDRRTGKPIASHVLKISSEAITEELSSERVTGFITIENSDEKEGRVAYENRGECFFLPFTREDLDDPNSQLKSKDKVTFYIAKDNSGSFRARHICLQDPHISPQRFQGIICTLKDSFGFIERSDVVKKIFFHSSECQNFKQLNLAENVEFSVQTRNNKQVAVNIEKLPDGTVVFDEIDPEILTGQVLETIEKKTNKSHFRANSNSVSLNNSNGTNEVFPGNIVMRKNGQEVEIPFGERDIKGEFTLNFGDFVSFNIATDKRDNLKHATNIEFLEETFNMSAEKREKGFVVLLEENYGFIKCFNREANQVLFKYGELLDPSKKVNLNDEVEFTITSDSQNTLIATRIKSLPNGTVLKMFDEKNDSQTKHETGFIVQLKKDYGLIKCLNKKGNIIPFKYDSISEFFELNDEVEFNLNTLSNNLFALNVKKLPAGTIIKNIIAENQNKQDFFTPYTMLSQKNNFIDNEERFDQYSLSDQVIQLQNESNYQLSEKLLMNNQSDFVNSNIENNKEPNWNYQIKNSVDNKFEQNNLVNGNLFDSFLKDGTNFINLNSIDNVNFNNENQSSAKNQNSIQPATNKNTFKTKNRGFIAALKDSYGFIESEDHQNEVFFHFSVFEGNIQTLNLLQEVEYFSVLKNGKLSAEYVRKIPQGTIDSYEILPIVLNGVVNRSVRCLNPEQDDYCGLIQQKDDNFNSDSFSAMPNIYEFSMTSLNDIYDFLQKDDIVTFQLAVMKNGQKRAVNVKPVREKYQALVDAIKGSFGFLNYEVEGGKKLFFHMSEVKDANTNLQQGDTVEFVIIDNKRTGKFSACSVVKINSLNSFQRPDRLMKSKNIGNEDYNQNKNSLMRQPKGPDGTKGFNVPRMCENFF